MSKPIYKKPSVQKEEAPIREITVKRGDLKQWGLVYDCPECNMATEVQIYDIPMKIYWCRRATCNLRFRVIDY